MAVASDGTPGPTTFRESRLPCWCEEARSARLPYRQDSNGPGTLPRSGSLDPLDPGFPTTRVSCNQCVTSGFCRPANIQTLGWTVWRSSGSSNVVNGLELPCCHVILFRPRRISEISDCSASRQQVINQCGRASQAVPHSQVSTSKSRSLPVAGGR